MQIHSLMLRCLVLVGCLTTMGSACAADDPGTTPGPTGGTLAAFCAGSPGQAGCCQGSTLVWCEGDKAVAIECADNLCGYWAPDGIYDCYASDQGPARHCPSSSDTICAPTCNGRCGVDDGCGGTCGCASGKSCQGGVCIKGSSPEACETLMHIGCCDGNTRRFCKDGKETSEACTDSCGWNSSGWYSCGQTGADPTGNWPQACN